MREIKFQYIWQDRDDKFHILTEKIEDIEEYMDIVANRRMGWTLVGRREWTGLHDKNSKEIYEGDIVRWYDHNWQIAWDGLGAWAIVGALFSYQFTPINHGEMEVIGNIYENPELLEGKTP